MRLNKFLASATGMGRRTADIIIQTGRVRVNDQLAKIGQEVSDTDVITLDRKPLEQRTDTVTIMLNKPVGYVVSRKGQGSKTIYDLLPIKYHELKPIGRLDKNSSGLLLLTNDGELANQLAHPGQQKVKIYEVVLDKPLAPLHRQMITDYGVLLDDGPSKFQFEPLDEKNKAKWRIIMHEGRNRQIRRTFKALGYSVSQLHRMQFGNFTLGSLTVGEHQVLPAN